MIWEAQIYIFGFFLYPCTPVIFPFSPSTHVQETTVVLCIHFILFLADVFDMDLCPGQGWMTSTLLYDGDDGHSIFGKKYGLTFFFFRHQILKMSCVVHIESFKTVKCYCHFLSIKKWMKRFYILSFRIILMCKLSDRYFSDGVYFEVLGL